MRSPYREEKQAASAVVEEDRCYRRLDVFKQECISSPG